MNVVKLKKSLRYQQKQTHSSFSKMLSFVGFLLASCGNPVGYTNSAAAATASPTAPKTSLMLLMDQDTGQAPFTVHARAIYGWGKSNTSVMGDGDGLANFSPLWDKTWSHTSDPAVVASGSETCTDKDMTPPGTIPDRTGIYGWSPSGIAASDAFKLQIDLQKRCLDRWYAAVDAKNAAMLGAGSVLTARFEWNFETGVSNPGPYSSLIGFNAAHTYDRPGTYKITLKVTNELGESSIVTRDITVLPSARKLIYISKDGSGDGSSSSSPLNFTSAGLDNIKNSNVTFLFKRGDTFDLGTSGIYISGSNVLLSSYGTGELPLITSTQTGNSFLFTFDTMTQNNVIENLAMSTQATAVKYAGINLTVRNCRIDPAITAFTAATAPVGILIQNNSVAKMHSYGVYLGGTDISILGNTFLGSVAEHILRSSALNSERVLAAHNKLNRTEGKTVVTFRQTRFLSFNKNTITSDGSSPTSFSPTWGDIKQWDIVTDSVDRNVISDPKLDTFIRTQAKGSASWAMNLPNGTYSVTIGVGDPGVKDPVTGLIKTVTDSTYAFEVQGSATSPIAFQPTSTTPMGTLLANVDVVDGKLKISNGSGTLRDSTGKTNLAANNKIQYVTIKNINNGRTYNIHFQPAASTVPNGFMVDTGEWFALRPNGQTYGWSRPPSGESIYGTPNANSQWIVVEANTMVNSKVEIARGVQHLMFRNNIMKTSYASPLIEMNLSDYTLRYGFVDDISIINNTGIVETTSTDPSVIGTGKFLKVNSTKDWPIIQNIKAGAVKVVNNLFVAPDLKIDVSLDRYQSSAAAVNFVDPANSLIAFAKFDHNFWPLGDASSIANATPFMLGDKKLTIDAWNKLTWTNSKGVQSLSNDIVEDIPVDAVDALKTTPDSRTQASNTAIPQAGLFVDHDDHVRPQAQITAGALQIPSIYVVATLVLEDFSGPTTIVKDSSGKQVLPRVINANGDSLSLSASPYLGRTICVRAYTTPRNTIFTNAQALSGQGNADYAVSQVTFKVVDKPSIELGSDSGASFRYCLNGSNIADGTAHILSTALFDKVWNSSDPYQIKGLKIYK